MTPQKRISKIRRTVYIFIICCGLMNIFFPCVAHADMFGFEVADVYLDITQNVKETNDILNEAFQFCLKSPYDIMASCADSSSAGKIKTAVQTVALVVATLLLMMDFFKKTTNFEWASKWENILVFLVKVIVVKQIICNADTIIAYIYAGFNYICIQATNDSVSFLPYGTTTDYPIQVPFHFVEYCQEHGTWSGVMKMLFSVDVESGQLYDNSPTTYTISQEAVKMFYPNAVFPSPTSEIVYASNAFPYPTDNVAFTASWEMIKWNIYFLIMKAIAYVIYVVAIGRVFELCIYLIFAPLPLATFASDTTHDVAKNFIKNFIAAVLQIAMIAVMFVVYTQLQTTLLTPPQTNEGATASVIPLMPFIILIALGLGVVKSGTWSKKVCGIA